MNELVQALVAALALGSQYALLALGLAMVFSVLNLVNFAHGELITIGAYSALGLASLGAPWILLVVGAVAASTVAAVAMERVAFRPVRNAAATTMLLTSFGVSIIIQSLFASLVSARPRAVPQPSWLSDGISVAGVSIQWIELFTIGISAVVLGALILFLQRTLFGTAMRAAATDFDAVRLMGINANRVIAAAFVVSGLLAGVTSVTYLARLGTVEPTMGFMPVLAAFVATVIGGIGSLKGAAAGGLALGFAEIGLRTWLPSGVTGFTPAFVFLGVALLLIVRPRGLFGADEAVRV